MSCDARSVRSLLACLAGSLVACSLLPRGEGTYASRPGPYDLLHAVTLEEVALARQLCEEGELATARPYVHKLAGREPHNLPLACLAQDLDIALGDEAAVAAERERARSLARDQGGVPALLLAARLEPESEVRRELLDAALEREPESAWVHYAIAHHEALAGRWSEASRRVDRALLIDPGHLGARRLETMLLARAGERDDAIAALQRWLRTAAPSPFVSQRELAEARLDLAQLMLLEGNPRAAGRVLEELVDGEVRSPRLYELLAAVEQDQQRPRLALAAAWQAEEEAPGDPLPLVQQALLHEEWLADPGAAREAWRRVVETARGGSDLATLLLVLRARAALERLGPGEVPRP